MSGKPIVVAGPEAGRTIPVAEGATLPELCAMSVEAFRCWLAERRWSDRQRDLASSLNAEQRITQVTSRLVCEWQGT